MTSLPCSTCKGRCCTFAPFTRRELKTARKKHGIPVGAAVVPYRDAYLVVRDDEGTCAYLSPAGRCSCWADRPKVCQLYGEHPALPCAYLHPEASQAAREGLAKLTATPTTWASRAFGETNSNDLRGNEAALFGRIPKPSRTDP